MEFGQYLQLTVGGASHARCLRFTLKNFPAGFRVDAAALAAEMARRAPGRDALSTARREPDAVKFLSGIDAAGVTTGEPIRGEIANVDARPGDYGEERTVPRPGHADFTQYVAMGRIPTGGGANSGRLTAPLVAVGALARQWLHLRGIAVAARVGEVGGAAADIASRIAAARSDGDSLGGTVECEVTGLPVGLGGPLFEGLESELAAALMAIPGAKGVEFGNGFAATRLRGSENDDEFAVAADGRVVTATNRHGGILGGRTSGMPVTFRVALKPTPTVFKPLKSVDLATGRPAVCATKGRHDPCIVLRAVSVVEALAAFVLADRLLKAEAERARICLTLTAPTLAGCLEQYAAERYFTDLVELRADLLAPEERERSAEFPAQLPVPVVLTFRRRSDGGAFDGAEAERVEFFRRTLGSAARPFAYVDFEDDFRVDELAALAARVGTRIVRSRHCFDGFEGDVVAECRRLRGATQEIPKLAVALHSLAAVTRLMTATADFDEFPHILCAMGPLGRLTRILASRTHSLWTYASVGGLGELGHLTPHELVRTYRFRTATRSAELLAVTGWPLKASRSPELHNGWFAAEDEDAVLFPMPAETAAEAVAAFHALQLRAMAVTIPHKRAVMPLLDRVDAAAAAIGAVNTVVREAGRLVGYNTDAAGFAAALREFAGEVRGRKVAVLGDGGAAQAVKYVLGELGADFEVFHRRTPGAGFELIVNATPVDPIPDYVFSGRELVYDLGYVPAVTPLLKRAQAAGCRTANGFGMLRAQALEQRRLYVAAREAER